jgi:hypothetical protein
MRVILMAGAALERAAARSKDAATAGVTRYGRKVLRFIGVGTH